jgi:TetR/AcrR family transcriptional regulator, copper-responsive repressor
MRRQEKYVSSAMEIAAPPSASTGRLRGRPRAFDRDTALDVAMRLFWRRGFEATSTADLAAAMGINPPSLYAAFGDKKRLFREAVERYQAGPGGFALRALNTEGTAQQAIERLLHDAARAFTEPDCPGGCMVVLAATNCAEADRDIEAEMRAKRIASEALIRDRIARGQAAGELPEAINVTALASFYATVFQGLSIQARDGASRQTLLGTAAHAMRLWPSVSQ